MSSLRCMACGGLFHGKDVLTGKTDKILFFDSIGLYDQLKPGRRSQRKTRISNFINATFDETRCDEIMEYFQHKLCELCAK